MTRAALYGRYSSEGQREASIEDQYRNCERYAEREGWQIVERYHDKAISGTKDEEGRGGYKAMLKAAKAQQFDVLLVDDLSRLTRDEAELITTRKRLVFYGVRLVSATDGFDTAQKSHKILAAFHGIKNETFLDELKEKTYRGLTGQALKGFHCGGRVYGYKHVPIEHPTDVDQFGRPKIMAVRREIDEAQAQWVRLIFQWYADGRSTRDICEELNRRRVPAPGALHKRKQPLRNSGLWDRAVLQGSLAQACGMLGNPIYIGRVIWNRRETMVNPETKATVFRFRPESEWIVKEQSDLRIIDQALWDKVQLRRHAHVQPTNGKAQVGRGPKYLLSGLLKCAVCGGNFIIADYYRYACAKHLNSGSTACANGIRAPRKLAEDRCLAALRDQLLAPDAVERLIQKTTRLLAEHARQSQPETGRTRQHLAKVERELANIMTAIKQGILTPTTKAELEQAEAERARLQAALTARTAKADKVVALLPRAAERYRALVNDLGSLSRQNIAAAREQIRALVGEIKLVPTTDGYLEAVMQGRYEGVLKLAVGNGLNNVKTIGGFWRSSRDNQRRRSGRSG